MGPSWKNSRSQRELGIPACLFDHTDSPQITQPSDTGQTGTGTHNDGTQTIVAASKKDTR